MTSQNRDINRRDLVVSSMSLGLIGSNAATAEESAFAMKAPIVVAQATPVPRPATPGPSATRWQSAKQSLISSGRFPWLSSFGPGNSVDDVVFATLSAATGDPPYDGYQFETLMTAASALLDRCLVYRKEMYDLEEQGVRRALEYTLYTSQRDAQKSIELAAHIEQQRQQEKVAQDEAVSKFGNASTEHLAQGFKAITIGSAASSGIAEASERVRKTNVEIKWTALDAYQQALEDRHSTPGNALNYEERYNRVKTFLQQDVKNAYLRTRCIEKAVNKLYGLSVTLLPPAPTAYLDYLVLFIRDVIDKLELESLKEIEFEHVVHLHQGRWNKTSNSAVQRIDDNLWNTLTNSTGSGLLDFDLSHNEFPVAVQRIRMRALGLSFATVSPENQASHLKCFSAIVFPPMPDDLFSPSSKMNRNPIIIERISVLDPGAVRLSNYDPITNVDPRGEWKIQLSANSTYPDGAARARNADDNSRMLDLKLHLRLRGIVDKSPGSWADLSW